MFKEERAESMFDWGHLGNIALGRPHLGSQTDVLVYRLMQFSLRDAAIRLVGPEKASEIFYEGGFTAGQAFYYNVLGVPEDLDDLLARLQQALSEMAIGIFRVEEADPVTLTFTLTVAEDLDCSGLPIMEETVCTYDEGFIAGILESFTGLPFQVRETDCWCTGARVCRFAASPKTN